VYAYLTYRSRVAPLLIEINTRYGWVANPFPTGTRTPQETPSFTRRDNDQAQPTRNRAAVERSAGAQCYVTTIYQLSSFPCLSESPPTASLTSSDKCTSSP
jgi:hypothetical protein